MDKTEIFGVDVDHVTLDEVLRFTREVISADQRAIIANVNVRGLHFAYEHAWFRQFLNEADLVVCDGMGVKLGARLLGSNIPQRFTHADWTWPLAELAETHGFSLFLLGSEAGVPEKAAQRLLDSFPKLRIIDTHHGFFDKSPGHPENEAVIGRINSAQPDILFVGFGMPKQERWLQENWTRLNVKIANPCGALLEYLSGDLKRGPRWMTDHYLEWLARLMISPRRYSARYLRDNPLFLYRILEQKFLESAKR